MSITRLRVAVRLIGAPYRIWREIILWGVDSRDPVRERSVAGGNRFFVLASVSSIPGIISYLSLPGDITTHAGVARLTMVAAWLGCLILNRHRFYTWAAVLGIAVPLVGLTYLSLLFSRDSGFQLLLLAVSAMCFVLFVPSQWRLRLVFFVATAMALLWIYIDPRFAEVPTGVLADWLVWAAAANVFFTMVFIYAIAWFDVTGFMRERRRNDRLLRQARVAAQTDSLTNLLNRRGTAPVLARVSRQRDYCLALADLDHFKHVNDYLGHSVGDEVLARVARTLSMSVGSRGDVARWGGEEFLVVLPGMTLESAMTVMDSARAAVEQECVIEEMRQRLTVSVGVVATARGMKTDRALQEADARLYEAKESGRNSVVGTVLPLTSRQR
ncbi:MAG: GGDEF domain-containing protein [Demequina sp.]